MTEQVQIDMIAARQNEVAQYEKNIQMYESILVGLPNEWPVHLEQYRNSKNQHEAVAEIENLADVELLSKLWYADECRKAIRAETVEMTKAKSILLALQAQA